MKEYFGKTAAAYQQTDGKRFLLIPAFKRCIPKALKDKDLLLDVACGHGYYNVLAHEKGYQYFGVDISPDMIKRAKEDYPPGVYTVSPSTSFAGKIKQKFNVIVISMLFPVFSSKDDIVKTLKECKKVAAYDARILIGIPHPHFDTYMRKGLFGLDYVET